MVSTYIYVHGTLQGHLSGGPTSRDLLLYLPLPGSPRAFSCATVAPVTKGVQHPDGPGVELLSSPVRRAVVQALADHRPALVAVDGVARGPVHGMTAAQLATALGLHVTTVRFHLDQLVAGGLVRAAFSHDFGVGRPRKVYDVAPGALDPVRADHGYRALAELLTESFATDVTPAEAGRDWARRHVPARRTPPATTAGQWLGKVAQVVDVLQDWGYTPELSTSDAGRTCRIDLPACPFLDLARTNPAVVCGIHRGLIAGAMQQLGEDDTEVTLLPFVGPDLCRAQVRTRTPFHPRPAPLEEY